MNRSQSIWEARDTLSDIVIVGAGLSGTCTAINLIRKNPDLKITLIDRARISHGASTKNAGFLCTGSASELITTAEKIGWEQCWRLVKKRWSGRNRLIEFIRDHDLDLNECPGFEWFENETIFNNCVETLERLNEGMSAISGIVDYFSVHDVQNFPGEKYTIRHKVEGLINPHEVLNAMHKELINLGCQIIYQSSVSRYLKAQNKITVRCKNGVELRARKVLFATNAFSQTFFPDLDVTGARNQVLAIASDIKLDGCIHADQGYFYFRKYGKYLLAGGGRNVLGESEATSAFGETREARELLVTKVEKLFGISVNEVSHQWSGILGVGNNVLPIMEEYEKNVFVLARLSGMGVCISMELGHEMSDLMLATEN